MQNNTPILVTGVPGNVGSVGGSVVKLLRAQSSSQSPCTPPRQTISSIERRNGSRTRSSRPHKWCGSSKGIAWLQADVFWHECVATISPSYGYCSSGNKRNRRLRDSRQHLSDDSLADDSNRNDRITSAATTLALRASPQLVWSTCSACEADSLYGTPFLFQHGGFINCQRWDNQI